MLEIQFCGLPRHAHNCTCNASPSKITLWRRKNPEAARQLSREHSRRQQAAGYYRELYRRHRAEALARYGGACACCGEKNFKLLTFDHIVPIGKQSLRLTNNKNAVRHYRVGPIDTNLQVLCFNCNCGRAYNGGICPHQESAGIQP